MVYQAERDGDYAVRLFAFPETPTGRIGFAGGDRFVYRLALTTTGFVDFAYPLTVSEKQTDDVQVSGWSLPPDAAARIRRADHGSTLTLFHHGQPGWGEVLITGEDCLREEKDTSVESPLQCDLPFVVSGRIEETDEGDAYRFLARGEDRIRITVESRALGFPLDPVLEVCDDEQQQLVRQDDRSGRDCALDFKAPADGYYRAVVRDLHGQGGSRYVYRLTVREIKPSFKLEVADEVYVTKADEELAIPVKVVREDGFDQVIHVTAAGLPAGTLTSNSSSSMKDASEKEVKLIVKAPPSAARGPFQILGTTRSSDRHILGESAATVTGHSTHDFWLSVSSAERE